MISENDENVVEDVVITNSVNDGNLPLQSNPNHHNSSPTFKHGMNLGNKMGDGMVPLEKEVVGAGGEDEKTTVVLEPSTMDDGGNDLAPAQDDGWNCRRSNNDQMAATASLMPGGGHDGDAMDVYGGGKEQPADGDVDERGAPQLDDGKDRWRMYGMVGATTNEWKWNHN